MTNCWESPPSLDTVGESPCDAQCLELEEEGLFQTDVNDKSSLLWDLAAHIG